MSNLETNSSLPIPRVLRSRQHLAAGSGEVLVTSTLPITPSGVTYEMAQEVTWLDPQHFAVGRWDGSLSIFQFNQSNTAGPIINTIVSSPSKEGLQMITWLSNNGFVTSNDDDSLALWVSNSGSWQDLQLLGTLQYDPSWGVANSGESFVMNNTLYLVVGHENGYVTIWAGPPNSTNLSFATVVDVRSSNPVNEAYNVSSISKLWFNDVVVTGSQDGDLCIVQVPSGQILSRTRYNPAAQSGINSISTFGQNLLVANGAVGPDDKNLWYYWIDANEWTINLLDSTNLKIDPNKQQVFNFCVIWATYQEGLCFFSSTEEGALWMGTVTPDQKLTIFGYQIVTSPLGAAMAFNFNNYLAYVAYDLYEFTTGTPQDNPGPNVNPHDISSLSKT